VHFLSLSKTVAFSLMTFMWMQFWLLLMLSGCSAAQLCSASMIGVNPLFEHHEKDFCVTRRPEVQ
jgi:hypothetical protein